MELDCPLQPIIRSCSSRKWRDSNNGIFLVLPEDILMEILCRVPDKPLVRLKCLSKAWYFLISQLCIPIMSSPRTARPRPVVGLYCRALKLFKKEFQYVTRTRQHPLIYHFSSDCLPRKYYCETKLGHYASFNEEGDSTGYGKGQVFEWEECLSSYGLPFMPHPDDLLDCCNGLLLFIDSNSSDYYVSNPLTKQYVLIPRPPWSQQGYVNAALAFDPSKSTCYRVVRFERITMERSLVLHVYSSGNRSWSRHSVEQDHPCDVSRSWLRPSTYFDGLLFRLSLSWHLIQIDFEKFSVCATELPLTFGKSKGLIGCLGVLMGQLCYSNEDGDMMQIWSFEKEGSDNVGIWILRHNINIYDLTRGLMLFRECGPPDSKWVGPIAFHPSSNIVFLGTPIVILRFNLDNNTLEELIRIEKDLILPGCYHPAFIYVRYLAPFDKEGNIGAMPM
ncbi:F-box At5g07610-like [Olea europaea subsp. europaea]|uniref:F-box At5g07610-like n=1 Tax=Olea europaea subsp. europaea TaxID=158383 RepID=A0A8S0SFG6_OLEEU|nr:F-box At5g07610-like [Olea europaea subsp. europaea]